MRTRWVALVAASLLAYWIGSMLYPQVARAAAVDGFTGEQALAAIEQAGYDVLAERTCIEAQSGLYRNCVVRKVADQWDGALELTWDQDAQIIVTRVLAVGDLPVAPEPILVSEPTRTATATFAYFYYFPQIQN